MAAPPTNPRPWLFAVALNLLREEGYLDARLSRAELRVDTAEHRAAAERAAESPDRLNVIALERLREQLQRLG